MQLDPSNIQTKEDFMLFLGSLRQSYQDSSDEWENVNLETYLEALAAWLHDMDGYYRNRGEDTPTELSWRLLAEAFIAATMYE